LANAAQAGQPKKDAPAPDLKGVDNIARVVAATTACLASARVCLASCTNHLAMGMSDMADCQRSVMNTIAVCSAMEATATYNNADIKLLKSLAATCAAFCRACQKNCESHAAKHEECKACGEHCKACAIACEAFAA
jgi:Cys-rich four helix bundle protein (predicted Tat secretion target)